MKLTIKQNNTAEQVTSPLIDKLYLLSSGGTLTQDSTLEGVLSTQLAYEDSVSYLQERYTGLTINALNYYIRFADPEVLSVLLNAGFGDGTGVTTSEAATDSFGTLFNQNSTIEFFPELKYFTSALSNSAFNFCTNLKVVDLSNRTTLPKECFRVCTNLKKFMGENSTDGELNLSNLQVLSGTGVFTQCYELLNITSLGIVASIPESCFENCNKLETVHISPLVTSIGNKAFSGCSSLKAVYIEDIDAWATISFAAATSNPLNIAKHLYLNNTLVTSVSFSQDVTQVKNYAFVNCTDLTSLTLHGDMTIGTNAFNGCSNLNAIFIDSLDNWLSITFTFQPLQYAHNLYINGSLVQNVTIPSGTDLTNKFYGSTSLTSVVIDSGVTSIGNNAFEGCSTLTSISLPNTLTKLGTAAFRNCTSLTSISIPSGVTLINQQCFEGCSNLTSVALPSTVTKLDNRAFQNCSSLTTIAGTENVSSLGYGAFNGTAITTIPTFSASLTTIPDTCFNTCKELTGDLVIPGNIKTIGSRVFQGCATATGNAGLNNITFQEGVEVIGNYGFDGCRINGQIQIASTVTTIEYNFLIRVNPASGNPKPTVKFMGSTPPTFVQWTYFENVSTVYVPQGSLAAYQAAFDNGYNTSHQPCSWVEYTT